MMLQDLVFIPLLTVLVYGVQSTSFMENFTTDLEGYVLIDTLANFFSIDHLRVSVRYYKKGSDCIRVLVFNVRGAELEYVKGNCNTPKSRFGLVTIGNVVYYYSQVMFQKDIFHENEYSVIIKSDKDDTCEKSTYSVIDTKELQLSGKPATANFKERYTLTSLHRDCRSLHQEFNLNTIMLSYNNEVLGYEPEGLLNTYNPWEALGAKTIRYTNGHECFQLLILVSYGRLLETVRVSCGATQGLAVESDSLYYGNAVMIILEDEKNKFTLVLNHPDGYCIEETFSLKEENGKIIEKNILLFKLDVYQTDTVCQQLITRQTLKGEALSVYVDKYLEPAQEKELKGYKAMSLWNDVNLNHPLGMLTRMYKNDKEECIMVIVVSSGVTPVDSVFVTCGALQDLVIRGNNLYLNKQLSVRKDENDFYVLVNDNDESCFSRVRRLLFVGERLVSQEISQEKLLAADNQECNALITEKYLKHP